MDPSKCIPANPDPSKCIPANPDISGIGVRIAIYAQNLLCFLPIIFYLYDGEISLDELAGIQDQSIGMLAIAFAILITTAFLAAERKVTNYHAAIILGLSWMNNTSTWIWFILYVYERSTAKYQPIGATWSTWYTALWSPVRIYLHGLDPAGSHDSATGTPTPNQGGENGVEQTRSQKAVKCFWNSLPIQWLRAEVCRPVWLSKPMIYLRRFARLILAAPVLSVGSLHLSLMAAIGIWLWHDPVRFGSQIPDCTPMLTVFGAPFSLKSIPLRIFSLTMYSLLLIPGLNLLPPFAFFLFLHISYNHACTRISTPANARVRTAFLYIGLSSLVAINILFIVDTELTLQRNKDNQQCGESDWGFGQILALLLLLVPLRDAWIALRNIQNNVQQRFEQAFRTVAEAEIARDDLSKLLLDGANPRQQIPGRFGNFLQMAAYYGKQDLMKLLVPENGQTRVDVDAVGEMLPSTSSRSVCNISCLGGDYGTALQAAAARGHEDVVQYLLGAGAQPNIAGGCFSHCKGKP